jgi:heptosyltransferase-2
MRIVVRGTNWIGDAVMTIPAMQQLRRIFPDSYIALHTRSWAEGIFRDAGFIDEIISFDSRGSKLRTALNESHRLRRHDFDLAILFPNSFVSAVAVRLAGISRRFGYATDGRRLLLTAPVDVPDWKSERHEIYYYLNLVANVERRLCGSNSVAATEPLLSLDVSEERRSDARIAFRSQTRNDRRLLVGLGVGSTNSMAKRWPAENYSRLNDRLQEELNAGVILLGSVDEADVAAQVAAGSRNEPVNLSGRTTLPDAVAYLSELDMFISNDMGLAHISAAVGTPTITIFGPTNPVTTRPLGNNVTIVKQDVECSPCMLRVCPIDHRCMIRVTVDEVFETASKALRK